MARRDRAWATFRAPDKRQQAFSERSPEMRNSRRSRGLLDLPRHPKSSTTARELRNIENPETRRALGGCLALTGGQVRTGAQGSSTQRPKSSRAVDKKHSKHGDGYDDGRGNFCPEKEGR